LSILLKRRQIFQRLKVAGGSSIASAICSR
jgi:hypothetical protein